MKMLWNFDFPSRVGLGAESIALDEYELTGFQWSVVTQGSLVVTFSRSGRNGPNVVFEFFGVDWLNLSLNDQQDPPSVNYVAFLLRGQDFGGEYFETNYEHKDLDIVFAFTDGGFLRLGAAESRAAVIY
jgi:hypothetical protein